MAEKPIKEANNITLDGYEVLGKMVKSGGGRRQSATVSQKNELGLIKTAKAWKTLLEDHLLTFQRKNIQNFLSIDAQFTLTAPTEGVYLFFISEDQIFNSVGAIC